MKDKLRELAAKYRRHATSCGSPIYENCATDLLAILDAEGDDVIPEYTPKAAIAHTTRDGERLEYVMSNISGRELRGMGIHSGSANWRQAIDAAIQGERHER